MTELRSKNHQIVVNRVLKFALSSYDYKPYQLNNGIHSLAYGFTKLRESQAAMVNLFHILKLW